MSGRARVLFVISQLIQGGAERWLFEVARALDPARFQVEILTQQLVRGARHAYLAPLVAHGIPVHRALPAINALIVAGGLRAGRPFAAYEALGHATRAALGRRWFRGYDLVCPVQIENWFPIARCVDPAVAPIHLMANGIQYDHDVHAPLRNGRRYDLVLFNEGQRDDVVGVRTLREPLVWPLAMDLSDRPSLAPTGGGSPKIGVFTRVSRQKPLEPLLYAFQALRERRPDAQLHVFGGGDPEVFGPTLDLLHLRDVVRFRGHATDLLETLRRERLALCWMLSVDDAMGYAGIEIGSVGVPVLFWNLGVAPTERVLGATQGTMRAYRSVPGLVDETERLLADPSARLDLGERLRAHILARHEIRATIGRLEAHYLEAIARG